jgi:L-histidine Nalpha-methyltransferase
LRIGISLILERYGSKQRSRHKIINSMSLSARGLNLDGSLFVQDSTSQQSEDNSIAEVVRSGLTASVKYLPAWLFYDSIGSELFERITELPEYYLSRTERELFIVHAEEILQSAADGARITIAELGAGTAKKTGILLNAAASLQGTVLYQPIDVSPTALDEAQIILERDLPGVQVRPAVANYVSSPLRLHRPVDPQSGKPERLLILYIGSSIGNFSPEEARTILRRLREQMNTGDTLLLGTDLAPGPNKTTDDLLLAYDDPSDVTADFNRNILRRLNRELDANFNLHSFAHEVRWNKQQSRIEMHLRSLQVQSVSIPRIRCHDNDRSLCVRFVTGETIHTENSYKYTDEALQHLLSDGGFRVRRQFADPTLRYMITLGEVA